MEVLIISSGRVAKVALTVWTFKINYILWQFIFPKKESSAKRYGARFMMNTEESGTDWKTVYFRKSVDIIILSC